MTSTARSVSRPRSDLAFFQLNSPLRPFEWLLECIFRLPWKRLIFWASIFSNFLLLEWKKMIDLDYSLELHQVNCEEYYWPGSEQRIIPCILFLANTRDRKLYAENVSTLSQMYKSLGNKLLKINKANSSKVVTAWKSTMSARHGWIYSRHLSPHSPPVMS